MSDRIIAQLEDDRARLESEIHCKDQEIATLRDVIAKLKHDIEWRKIIWGKRMERAHSAEMRYIYKRMIDEIEDFLTIIRSKKGGA